MLQPRFSLSSILSYSPCDETETEKSIDGEKVLFPDWSPRWRQYAIVHYMFWIISLGMMVIALIITGRHIYKHMVHYVHPGQQKYELRILALIPIYAIAAFGSLSFYQNAIYWDIGSTVYESVAIAAFRGLMLSYIGNTEEAQSAFYKEVIQPDHWIWPFTDPFCTAKCRKDKAPRRYPHKPYDKQKLKQCARELRKLNCIHYSPKWRLDLIKWGTYQYFFFRSLMTIAAAVLQIMGQFGDYDEFCQSSWSIYYFHVWDVLLPVVSAAIAVYCLANLYDQIRTVNKPVLMRNQQFLDYFYVEQRYKQGLRLEKRSETENPTRHSAIQDQDAVETGLDGRGKVEPQWRSEWSREFEAIQSIKDQTNLGVKFLLLKGVVAISFTQSLAISGIISVLPPSVYIFHPDYAIGFQSLLIGLEMIIVGLLHYQYYGWRWHVPVQGRQPRDWSCKTSTGWQLPGLRRWRYYKDTHDVFIKRYEEKCRPPKHIFWKRKATSTNASVRDSVSSRVSDSLRLIRADAPRGSDRDSLASTVAGSIRSVSHNETGISKEHEKDRFCSALKDVLIPTILYRWGVLERPARRIFTFGFADNHNHAVGYRVGVLKKEMRDLIGFKPLWDRKETHADVLGMQDFRKANKPAEHDESNLPKDYFDTLGNFRGLADVDLAMPRGSQPKKRWGRRRPPSTKETESVRQKERDRLRGKAQKFIELERKGGHGLHVTHLGGGKLRDGFARSDLEVIEERERRENYRAARKVRRDERDKMEVQRKEKVAQMQAKSRGMMGDGPRKPSDGMEGRGFLPGVFRPGIDQGIRMVTPENPGRQSTTDASPHGDITPYKNTPSNSLNIPRRRPHDQRSEFMGDGVSSSGSKTLVPSGGSSNMPTQPPHAQVYYGDREPRTPSRNYSQFQVENIAGDGVEVLSGYPQQWNGSYNSKPSIRQVISSGGPSYMPPQTHHALGNGREVRIGDSVGNGVKVTDFYKNAQNGNGLNNYGPTIRGVLPSAEYHFPDANADRQVSLQSSTRYPTMNTNYEVYGDPDRSTFEEDIFVPPLSVHREGQERWTEAPPVLGDLDYNDGRYPRRWHDLGGNGMFGNSHMT